jgi:beta-glucosidase
MKAVVVVLAAVALAIPSLSSAEPAVSNLALGAVATASSSESAQYPASNAIDGDATTRWSSAFSDPQTLTVDLGARASISDIALLWEAAYGKAYKLEVSNDGAAWTQVAATDNSDGGTDDYPGLSATGRYVRLTGTARALPYGYSLYEIQVNGEFTETAVAPAASAYSMLEKDGTVTVPVRLNRASDSAVTVKYATADGTASAGKDYEAASGTLTFAPGETSKTITLHSIDDGVDEPNETFDLNFSDSSVTIGPRSKATITVIDDDEATFDGKVATVDGFEGTLNVLTAPQPPNNSGLFTFSDSAADRPTLTASPNPRPGSTGTQSLSVVATTANGGYGGFSDNLPASQDWSSYDGFSFWFKGTGTGHNLEFEIKDGGTDGEHSELWNSHVLDDSTAWKFVHLPFSAFTKRTDYQPSGGPSDGKLNLTAMWGWAMNLVPGQNAFLVDDAQVYEQVRNVETFEGPATVAQRGMFTFNGNNAPPTLTIEPLARDGVTDNHALRVDYDTPAGQYGGFGQDFADTQDWSAFKGLRFWFYGRRTSASPATINIEIKDGGTGPGASELWTTSFLDDTQGWKLVTIPFSKLKYRTDYQPVGGIDHVLNLTKMWGYAVTPPAGDHGSFDFDDVQTYGVNTGVPDVSFATDKPVYLAKQGDTVTVGVTMTTVDGKPLAEDQQVSYATADDTAVAGTDYTPASGTLTFAAGTASGTTKTFPVTLLSPAGASLAKRLKVTLGGSDTPAVIAIAAHGLPYLDSSLPVETRVNDLLARMSTAEKIGQMTQAERLALDAPGDIATFNLGSILSGGGSTPTPNTPAGWQDMIGGFQTQAMTTRLQIPLIYGADVVHGHNNVTGAALFPHNIGIGAAHDPSLGADEGAVSAAEMKATGVQWAFAPCLCVSRDERWGRAYESFGEDPALVIQNEDVIDGFQDNGTLATAKHFAGDGGTTYGSSTQGSYKIDQGVTPAADMETLHLPPFDAAIKQHHVGSVMPSYSSVGYPTGTVKMHANKALLTDWLKQQEGFDGFVITDWQAIDQLPGNYDSQVVTSINAGIDMVMTPYEYQAFEASLTNAVASGAVPLTRVDDAVKRILREKFRLGLFEHPFPDASKQSDFGTPEHRAKARKAAAESQVLLKNDGVLPLS